MPILPIVFREKAAAMLNGGNVRSAYEETARTVFRPSWTLRAGASALQATAAIERSLEQQFERVSRNTTATRGGRGNNEYDCGDCGLYCQSIAEAIDLLHAGGKQAIAGTQPLPGTGMRPI